MNARITWSDLEVGHEIVGGWKVVSLTASHITVSDGDGEMSTFKRKDPWEPVEVELPTIRSIIDTFGGHPIEREEGGLVGYFVWPDDEAFITAAQSHLARQHQVDAETRTYAELMALHEELHRSGGCDHEHIARLD